MASYTFYGVTADAGVYCTDSSWTAVQTGAGTLQTVTASGTSLFVGKQKVSTNYQNFLQGVGFDTSSIPDDAEILTAIPSFCASTTDPAKSWTLEARDFNWGPTITTADYRTASQWSALPLLAEMSLSAGLTVDTYYAMTGYGTNLVNAINKTGVTYFMLGASNYGGIAPTNDDRVVFYSADETGTSKDPKLEVTTFEAPDFTPQVMWIA